MIFKGSPKSLKESYFTGELRLGESPNSPLHRYTLFLISEEGMFKISLLCTDIRKRFQNITLLL